MIVRDMAMRQRSSAPTADELLDLGSIPVEVTPAAREALAKLPKKALKRMTGALGAWAAKAPVSAAKALYYVDYEDPDLKYVFVNLLLVPPQGLDIDEEVEFALKVGDELAKTYVGVLESLPEKDKRRMFDGLLVDLTWPEDWDYVWGDESSAPLRS
jgi:hypothetical protein